MHWKRKDARKKESGRERGTGRKKKEPQPQLQTDR